MNKSVKIAVCLTCHNRKEKTIKCLDSLHKQRALNNGQCILSIFLCDDGSNDGTADEVKRKYPNINVIQGDGTLFWARGMEVAFSASRNTEPDFFLMINDDVEFNDNMLELMIDSYNAAVKNSKLVSVVGTLKDSKTNEWSYGGKMWKKRLYKDVKSVVYPQVPFAKCDLANWNCFLIPADLAAIVGNIETAYTHAMADYDYSIRIMKNGGQIVVASDYVGTCSRNNIEGTWQDVSIPLFKRYKLLHNRTARPPKSYAYYCKIAYGKAWLYWFFIQYIWIAKTSIQHRIK
ncbi:glycosyltransferase family 2 protein [Bacillus sp. USDA818B3_A]|uniref:glycosyltransferase family 2 protein n=1 Tax=Bacillus sp. USDA818B3_A TaxID=2698834 RepID=UPI00136FE8DC|nr:glycosyltransferase [Bacillus sp. USDA818B3_A]